MPKCPYRGGVVLDYDNSTQTYKRLLVVYTCHVGNDAIILDEKLFKNDYDFAIEQKWDDSYDGMVFLPCLSDC